MKIKFKIIAYDALIIFDTDGMVLVKIIANEDTNSYYLLYKEISNWFENCR